MNSSYLMIIAKYVAVLVAAGIIGNWFLAELKKAHSTKAPWYKPYLSAPGLLIVIAILLPVFYWLFTR